MLLAYEDDYEKIQQPLFQNDSPLSSNYHNRQELFFLHLHAKYRNHINTHLQQHWQTPLSNHQQILSLLNSFTQKIKIQNYIGPNKYVPQINQPNQRNIMICEVKNTTFKSNKHKYNTISSSALTQISSWSKNYKKKLWQQKKEIPSFFTIPTNVGFLVRGGP
jgi:hypothetical protein